MLLAGSAGGFVCVEVAAMAIFRGGIRDVTLAAHGFNVWDRQWQTNGIVVVAFFVAFLVGLGFVVWLGTVVARAQAVEERYV